MTRLSVRHAHRLGLNRRLRTLWREPTNVRGWAAPTIDLVRYREFEFAFGALARHQPAPRRILDISSPKLLPLTLARYHPAAQVASVDILDSEARRATAWARQLHLGNFQAHAADARRLPFASDHFDLVTSISVFEHIAPEDRGEIPAVRELARVLAPGGVALLTIPFAPQRFSEYRDGDVYERARDGSGPVFFQRFYDWALLQSNLIEPSGLDVLELAFIEERHAHSDPRRRLAQVVDASRWRRLVLGPVFPLLARVFLSPPQPLEHCRKPYIACLALGRPGQPA